MYRALTTFMCLLALSAHAGDLKIYSVRGDSSVVFKTASFNDELNEISASLENPSATELKSITVRGAFFKEGKRTGGFALTVPTRVYAHGYVNLHTIVASDMLSQADVLLLSTDSGDSVIAAREPLRLLDANLKDAQLIGGANVEVSAQRKLTPEPNLPIGGCCTSCYSDAQGCGRNLTKLGNCTGACTSYYSCSYTLSSDGQTCLSVTCTFNCKNGDTCC